MSATAAFAWLVVATAMGFVLSALGAAVVLLVREPARRVRAIELTLLACLVAPWLPAVPGLPRVAWREWLAGPDVAESEVPDTAAALSEPAEPTGASAVPESTETASSPPIIELAVVPEPGDAPLVDLTGDREPLPSAEPAVAAPIEKAEAPAVVAATPAVAVAPSPPPAVELPAERPVDWPAVVVALYLAGVAAIVLLDALGGLALLRVWKLSCRAESQVQALLREVAGQSVDRVSLLVSPRCRQPFTFAWLWPVIVLPPALVVPGKERELRWALAHEWSHVANRHTWGWTLAGLARAVYCPQPLVWLLRRRLRLEQDFLADAQAAGRAADAPDYAAFLTTQAATAHGLTLGLGIAGGKSELARRVVMLVQGKRPVAKCGWGWTLGLTATIALIAIGVGSLAPGGAAAQNEPVAPSAANEQVSAEVAERRIAPFDRLTIRLEHLPRVKASQQENVSESLNLATVVDSEGDVLIGARYGRVPVEGLTIEEAGRKITERVRSAADEDVAAGLANWSNKSGPSAHVEPAGSVRSLGIATPSDWSKPVDNFIAPPSASAPIILGNLLHVEVLSKSLERQVFFEYPVLDDGTIGRFARKGSQRIEGAVEVAGMTLAQAEEAIRKHVEVTDPAKVGYVAVQFVGWSDHLPNRGEQRGQAAPRGASVGGEKDRSPSDSALDQASPGTTEAPANPPAADQQERGVGGDQTIQPFDLLSIYIVDVPYTAIRSETQTHAIGLYGGRPAADYMKVLTVVESDGQALIDARMGRLPLAGLTFAEAEQKVRERVQAAIKEDHAAGRLPAVKAEPAVQVVQQGRAESRSRTRFIGDSPVIKAGDRIQIAPENGRGSVELAIDYAPVQVEPSGEAPFGPRLGRIQVAGLNLQQATERVRARILEVAPAAADSRSAAPVTGLVLILKDWRPKLEHEQLTRPTADMQIAPGDTLMIDVVDSEFRRRVLGYFRVAANGEVALARETPGAAAGIDARVNVAGKTVAQAEAAILEQLAKTENAKWVGVAYWDWVEEDARKGAAEQAITRGAVAPTGPPAEPRVVIAGRRVKIVAQGVLPDQPINGEFEVERDGTVNLGPSYGQIQIVGLTEAEAAQRIKRDLSRLVTDPEVQVALPEPRTALRYSGKSFDQWCEVLQNDLDPATRVEAIKALGKFGANGLATEAAEAIVPYIGFRDGDENVVYATALDEMRKIGEPALPIVLAVLGSSDAKIREAASHLLSQMPTDEVALAALVKALDDKSPPVRIAAAGALGAKRHELERAGDVLDQAAQLGDDQLLPTISMYLTNYFPPTEERLQVVSDYLAKTPPQMQLHFGQTNATNPDFVVRLMQKRLEEAMKRPTRREPRGRRGALDRDQTSFIEPLRALERLGPKAAPALPTILKLAEEPDAPNFFDLQIVQVLRAIGPAAAPTARPVLERLRDQSPSTNRKFYFDDLLRSWEEAPAGPATSSGEEPSKTTDMPAAASRQYAGKTFAQWRAVLDRDLDPATRVEAITAIGEFGASGQAEDAIRVLIPLLGSQARSDKQGVATAAQQALSKIGAPAVPALIECLKNGDGATQLKATDAFIYMGEAAAPAADALLDLAKAKAAEPDWQLPLVRAIAGIQSRPEATLPFLKAMASSPNQDVRVAALRGLSGLKAADEEVVPLVVNSIWSYSGLQGRSNFFQHLPIGGGRTAAVLRGLLERAKKDVASSDGMVQVLFIRAGEMGPAAAPLVPLMIEVSQQDPNWQGAAIYLVQALERIGPGAKEALPYLRGMKDGQTDPGLRKLVDAAINAIEGSQ